jgi:peptidoglycan lytic transglycosylase
VDTHIRARGRIVALLALGTTIGATMGTAAAPAAAQVNPLRVSARQHVLAGRTVPVHGVLTPAQAGRTVLVQVSRGHGWKTVARARTGARGRFQTKWRPGAARHYGVRAVLGGVNGAGTVRTIGGGVTVYRAAAASWYGPGLMGGHLACGGTLTASVVGVANKTMPCGSRVRLRYGGRTVVARVVDRGPYSGNREFDLTPATKQKLGFGSTGTVWASRLK